MGYLRLLYLIHFFGKLLVSGECVRLSRDSDSSDIALIMDPHAGTRNEAELEDR